MKNDYRLGNFVQRIGIEGDIRRIVSITNKQIEHIHHGIPDEEIGLWDDEETEPIVLSDEILRMAGFKKVHEIYYHDPVAWFHLDKQSEDGSYSIVLLRINIDKDTREESKVFFKLGQEKFLHKLQNIFYELSGQEIIMGV